MICSYVMHRGVYREGIYLLICFMLQTIRALYMADRGSLVQNLRKLKYMYLVWLLNKWF